MHTSPPVDDPAYIRLALAADSLVLVGASVTPAWSTMALAPRAAGGVA